jgi:signal transduction histidine kinase
MAGEDPREGPVKILIVEDSPTQMEQLRYMLENVGYHVIAAGNGKEAVDLLNSHEPSLIVSDIIMPGMDGFELCRYVTTRARSQGTPVILVTSLSDVEDVLRSLEAGASAFIRKPYDEEYLVSKIEQVLAGRESRARVEDGGRISISYNGKNYDVASNPGQVLDLLLSTFEAAVQQNQELVKAQRQLRSMNEDLERKVEARTKHLQKEITERRRAEEELKRKEEETKIVTQQLWQAAKLATMGELVASVAHELNNPLAIVSLWTESLLAQIVPDSPFQKPLTIMAQEIERMGNLTASLLQFGRQGKRAMSTVDVIVEVDNTIDLMYFHLKKRGITVERRYAQGIPVLQADRQQLRQVFLNTFANAGDAMPGGGRLTVEIRAEEIGEGSLLPDSDSQSANQGQDETDKEQPATGRYVIITVADTGVGISRENLTRIFEPFFTTKPEGEGTGLGMGICRRVVKEHNGTVQIESEEGKGTTVRIMLPCGGSGNSKSTELPAHGP